MINYNLLESQLLTYSDLFKNAKPFPHLIMDNFLDLEVAYIIFFRKCPRWIF